MTSSDNHPPGQHRGRNLVVCLDGTNNEPETGFTNVARMFDVAEKSLQQLVYYDPGVGTLAAPAVVTPWAKALTRAAGLIAGYGIRDNIAQAYTWLAHQYRADDRIFVFGFSRGAYTARALTGMLRTVGLLHADADNLTPYALKLFTKSTKMPDPGRPPDAAAKQHERDFWKLRNDFRERFSNADFPSPFNDQRKQIHFLGVWDTVKSVGWLNIRARIQLARWPFTANIANVATARHAMAIDEHRRPYGVYRFNRDALTDSDGRLQEVWFAGVHGDIGGQDVADDKLPDIALSWMIDHARAQDLQIDADRYERLLGIKLGDTLPADRTLGHIHPNNWWWIVAGGWRSRRIEPTDILHPSVYHRINATRQSDDPYRPKNLPAPFFLTHRHHASTDRNNT